MDETLLERCPLSRPVRDVKNLNRLFLLFHAEQNPVAAENQVSDFVAVERGLSSKWTESRHKPRQVTQPASAPRGAGSLVAESATEKGPTQPISYRVLSRLPVTTGVKRRQGCGRP